MPTERTARQLVGVDVAPARLALTGELDLGTVCALPDTAATLRGATTTTITIDLQKPQSSTPPDPADSPNFARA